MIQLNIAGPFAVFAPDAAFHHKPVLMYEKTIRTTCAAAKAAFMESHDIFAWSYWEKQGFAVLPVSENRLSRAEILSHPWMR